MRQFFVLCAAAALLAGPTAVHAALKIGKDSTAKGAMDSVTYAAETLMGGDNTTDATDTSDTTTYYDIGGDNLEIAGTAGIAANMTDDYSVTFTLEGMVFQNKVTDSSLNGGSFVVSSGGAAGDKEVVFRLDGTTTVAVDAELYLDANFAISAAGSGSITRTVNNQNLASLNVTSTETLTGSGIVKLASALKETADPMNLTATVESAFTKFSGGTDGVSTGSLGSLMVGVNTTLMDASDGSAISMLSDIMDTGDDGGTPAMANSSVTFMGDFSFTEMVFLHDDDDCATGDGDTAPTSDDNLQMTEGTGDDMVVLNETKPVDVEDFAMAQHLCIMVDSSDEDLRIPNTAAYTAMGSYKGLENAAIGPMPTEQTLGMVTRDGTTVHIPYMTTYEGYNQRVVISNRGGVDAPYTITFRPEDGVKANAKDAAMGTVMKMSTVTLSSTDLVEITGGARTAATIILEAMRDKIDVTSVTVNRESRDTDTVVHEPEM